jgi:HEAT repeat protein
VAVVSFGLAGVIYSQRPTKDASELDKKIARLIADLGVSRGGLRAPYCMPFSQSEADTAYARLLKIGKPAVPQLVAGLKSSNTYKQAHCAGLLGEIGDLRAVEPLNAMVVKEENAKSWVIEAIGALHDERSIPVLVKLLSEGSGELRSLPMYVLRTGRQAADALVEFGESAVPALEKALYSADEDVRANARYALEVLDKTLHRAKTGDGGKRAV